MKKTHDVAAVAHQFQIYGDLLDFRSYGSGHINDTYSVRFDQGGRRLRYIIQRINHDVFKDPAALMDNISRVTAHIALKHRGEIGVTRRVLTLIRAVDGGSFYRDPGGNFWRAFVFIEGARTYDSVESPMQAFQAAKAFGRFQRLLTDLPGPRLHDTISDFHDTPKRFSALEKAVAEDAANRAQSAGEEIEFALRRKPMTRILLDAGLPERVTHNDTKFNNIMFDDKTGEAICAIDLDTVMPGLAPYDFGDMVRTATSPAREDERDLSRVTMQFPMFESLARGFLSTAGDFLTETEKRLLPFSGKLITFEIGIRFLADYLRGDVYFKVRREGHNLDRCRTQFRLVESIERQEEQMNRLIEGL